MNAVTGEFSARCLPQEANRDVLKRALDLAVGGVALILALPIMALLSVLIRLRLGKPVLFRQERPGRFGRPFVLYKFRSMLDARNSDGELLPDEQRLTRFGRFLRASSLDELPELWNVMKGEMSLVGPRPLRMDYLPLYSPEQARRHDVRPGITGWAQVNGRNEAGWAERLRMDVWYVDNRNIWLDLRILLLTAWKVVRREGISADGHATMPPFRGER